MTNIRRTSQFIGTLVFAGLLCVGCTKEAPTGSSTSSTSKPADAIVETNPLDSADTGEPTDQAGNADTDLKFTHQVTAPTEYYKGGPQQASPPDGTLPPGTKVVIVEEAGSYVIIRTETGIEGYVSVGSIKPIEPSE